MKTEITPFTHRVRIRVDGSGHSLNDSQSEYSNLVIDAQGSKVRLTGNLENDTVGIDARHRVFLTSNEADKLGRMLQQYAAIA